jgi:hypothetical protein
MATTTNYGWTTPDDTALVKDGAAAIRTLGSSVDTTTKNLNPETTLGDIAYRSSTANVKTRLGLGTAGQVLKVNSGATAPEWATLSAGGMTLISSTTLSGASVTFSSIPATYKDLRLIFRNPLVATGSASIVMRVNGDSGSNRYRSTGGSVQPGLTFNATYWEIFYENSSSVGNGLGEVIIPDYANATSWKIMRSIAANVDPSNSSNTGISAYFNIYNQTAAISSLVVLPSSGNWTSGTVELYGVN